MKKYVNYVPPEYPDQLWNTRENGTLDIAHINNEPSLTQQQFKDECDINTIMRSYQETGTISHLNPRPGIYEDFSGVQDFKESMDLVEYAKKEFMLLPAKVRSRFNNNPAELVEFCNNPNNLEEAVELGLASPKKMDPNQNANLNANQNQSKTQPVAKPSKKSAVIPPQSDTDPSEH